MSAASPRTLHARALFAGLAERYDLLAEVLSFGQNRRWRRALVSRVPAGAGDRVLDVATGTAGVALALTERCGCRVVGLDPSAEMLRSAAENVASARSGDRVVLIRGRAEELPFAEATFDHVTFTYLLRYVDDPTATLRELTRVLRPGGTLAALEFGIPGSPPARAAWEAYTRVGLPVAGRMVSAGWAEAGRFLGPSIRDLYRRLPLDAQLDLWRAAGIDAPRVVVLSLGGGVVTWGRKRDGGG